MSSSAAEAGSGWVNGVTTPLNSTPTSTSQSASLTAPYRLPSSHDPFVLSKVKSDESIAVNRFRDRRFRGEKIEVRKAQALDQLQKVNELSQRALNASDSAEFE